MIQTLFGSLDEEQKPSFLDRMKEAVSRTRENLAARIEGLCRELGRPILLSEAFVSGARVEVEPVGRFVLKGMATEQAVSAPLS